MTKTLSATKRISETQKLHRRCTKNYSSDLVEYEYGEHFVIMNSDVTIYFSKIDSQMTLRKCVGLSSRISGRRPKSPVFVSCSGFKQAEDHTLARDVIEFLVKPDSPRTDTLKNNFCLGESDFVKTPRSRYHSKKRREPASVLSTRPALNHSFWRVALYGKLNAGMMTSIDR